MTGELLAQALAASQAIGDERSRAEALAALAPQLTGEARQQALAQALAASQAIGEEGHRAEALAALAPQLTGEPQRLAAGAGRRAAIGAERSRAEALAALAPQLTGDLLAQALAASQAIGDERHRARMLVAFLPVAPDPDTLLTAIRQAMAGHLWNDLRHGEREEVLSFCAEAQLFRPPVLDSETLAAIAGHIVEVCTQWNWL